MNANSADIKAAWDSYKTTADAKKSDYILDRRIFSIAYCAGQELTGSDWVLCCLHAETWARAKIADNPTFYDELKAGGWVVEGNKMTQPQISSAAYAAKDFSYFETAPVEAYSGFYWDNGEVFRFLQTTCSQWQTSQRPRKFAIKLRHLCFCAATKSPL